MVRPNREVRCRLPLERMLGAILSRAGLVQTAALLFAILLLGGGTSAMAQSADMAITKVGPASALTGTNATYTITIINNGPNSASTVSVSDTFPAGTSFVSASHSSGAGAFSCGVAVAVLTCSAPTVVNGEVDTFVLVLQIGNVPNNTIISNTANVISATADGNPANNSSTATTTAMTPSADLAITKVGPASVMSGTNATYTITMINNGPNPAQNVTVSDTIPPTTSFVSVSVATNPDGFTCAQSAGVVTCLAANVGAISIDTFVLVIQIPAAATNGTVFTNSARVSSTTNDPTLGNNTASAASTVVNPPADVSITKTGPASVTAGTNVTYTITIIDAGPNDAQSVTVSDSVPPGMTFVSASKASGPAAFNCAFGGGTVTCTAPTVTNGTADTFVLVFNAGANLPNGATITNTATITTTSTDATTADNTSSTISAVITSADVSITKTGPATVTAGQNITYTIQVANNGPSNAAGVSVSDTAPPGLTFVSNSGACTTAFPCSLGTLNSGQTATITATYSTSASTPNGSSATNTATVSSTTIDSNPGNNSSSTTATVTASADVSIVKTGPTTITYGTNTNYQIVVTNAGPNPATSVTVTDVIPGNESFVSVTTSQGSCSGTTTVTCNLGTLNSGGTVTIGLVVKINSGATASNTATVTSATPDPNSANNTSTTSTVTVTPISSTLVLTLIGFGLLAIYQMRRRRARAA